MKNRVLRFHFFELLYLVAETINRQFGSHSVFVYGSELVVISPVFQSRSILVIAVRHPA